MQPVLLRGFPMSEYMNLIGAEDVKAAGWRMAQAASDMQRAADTFADAVTRLERLWRDEIQPSLEVRQ